jgi:hypothetical protein
VYDRCEGLRPGCGSWSARHRRCMDRGHLLLPYLVLKLLWTVDIPVGITDRSVLDSNDWVAGNALMAVIRWRVCYWCWPSPGRGHAGCRHGSSCSRCGWAPGCCSRSSSAPCWWARARPRRRPPAGARTSAGSSRGCSRSSIGRSRGREPHWPSPSPVTCRPGGRVLGERTGEVVARRTARVRSWPEHHLCLRGWSRQMVAWDESRPDVGTWAAVGVLQLTRRSRPSQ